MVKFYWTLCDQFIKDKNVSVLPLLNVECLKVFEAIDKEMENGVVAENFVVEAVNRMRKLASKPVRTFDASMNQEMKDAWMEVRSNNNMEPAFHALGTILVQITEQVKNGRVEDAIGNLLALFSCLAVIKSGHEAWFEQMFHGGEMTDMVFLTDAAAEVYCHLRQRDDLPEDMGEDMDAQLLLLNQRTGFFGDWTMGNYADMLFTDGYQGQDYSELENCEVWMDLVECIQEVV